MKYFFSCCFSNFILILLYCSARLIAKYLNAYGVLASNRFVNMNALELKGQYVGQTAPRVIEAVQNAMGGCLFLDEAYSLADRGGDAFSDEAVRTLLTEVENNRTDFFCCLAGCKFLFLLCIYVVRFMFCILLI